MRALGGIGLVLVGILLLITGWGAFAGILLIIAGVAVWAWGVAGSQQDESLDAPAAGIVNTDVITDLGNDEQPSGVIDPNRGGIDPDGQGTEHP